MNQNKIPIINQKFDLFTFIKVLKKSFWIIVICFILAFVVGFIYLRYTPPKYESSSTVQVSTKNKTNEILGFDDMYDTGLEPVIELLRSTEFLKRCFTLLPLEVSYYKQGTFLSNELYKTSPFEVDYQITNGSLLNIPLYVNFKDGKILLNYDLNGDELEYYLSPNQWVDIKGGAIKIKINNFDQVNLSQGQLNKNEYYFVVNSSKHIINDYSSRLRIKILNKVAGTIEITFIDKNARKSADIVNIISAEFIKYDIEKKKESANNIINYINKQLGLVFTQLDSTEKELHDFKKSNRIPGFQSSSSGQITSSSMGMGMPIFTTKITEFENEVINISFEIQTLKHISSQIQSAHNINVYELMAMLTGTRSEGFMSNMLKSMLNLYDERAVLLNDVTEDNHKIKTIDKQIEAKKEQILNFIETTIERLEQSKKNYQSKIDEYEGEIFSDTSYQEIEFSRLKRLYTINENFYHQLIRKKAEYMISQAGYVSDNTILENATVPKDPVSPSKKNVLLLVSIIALFISFIIILVRYLFYNKISTIQEISNFTEIPIIGAIPLYSKKSQHSQLLVHKNPKSIITESFRNIRSNMEFLTDSNSSRVITISSTVSGEGKTFVAINLGGILAMTNKKVVLIDLDLRKPRLHNSFKLENNKGISTILIKKHNIEECLHKSEIDNLDIITSGPVPPNPSELVLTQNYLDLLDELKKRYDYIVIDTPPIGIVTDAIRSYQNADYSIYITRAGHSPRTFISYINKLSESKIVNNLSLVLNGVEESSGKYGYGYGYNYGYSYGYGYSYSYSEYINNQNYYDEPIKKKKSLLRFLKRKNK